MSKDLQPTLGHGKICYLEIPCINVNVSANFYKDVFGWNIRNHEDGQVAFDDGVGQVSGMWVTNKSADSNPGIIIHIMVDDAFAALGAIVSHGGKIVQEIGADYPEITARFSDPAGNVMSIFQERTE